MEGGREKEKKGKRGEGGKEERKKGCLVKEKY